MIPPDEAQRIIKRLLNGQQCRMCDQGGGETVATAGLPGNDIYERKLVRSERPGLPVIVARSVYEMGHARWLPAISQDVSGRAAPLV